MPAYQPCIPYITAKSNIFQISIENLKEATKFPRIKWGRGVEFNPKIYLTLDIEITIRM